MSGSPQIEAIKAKLSELRIEHERSTHPEWCGDGAMCCTCRLEEHKTRMSKLFEEALALTKEDMLGGPENCTNCVHGYDVNLGLDAPVNCYPQRKQHPSTYKCTAYRRMTLLELKERNDAEFGKPVQQ